MWVHSSHLSFNEPEMSKSTTPADTRTHTLFQGVNTWVKSSRSMLINVCIAGSGESGQLCICQLPCPVNWSSIQSSQDAKMEIWQGSQAFFWLFWLDQARPYSSIRSDTIKLFGIYELVRTRDTKPNQKTCNFHFITRRSVLKWWRGMFVLCILIVCNIHTYNRYINKSIDLSG